MSEVSDSSMATQCLAFCQALTSQGMAFKISLTVGKSFSFIMDSKMKDPSTSSKARKKVSPSTAKRNSRRRTEFLESKKSQIAIPKDDKCAAVLEPPSAKPLVSCDVCGHNTKTKNGMKLHKKNINIKHVGQTVNCTQCGKKLNSHTELNTHIINEHTVASMEMQGNQSSLSVQNDTSFVFSDSMLDEFDY